MNEPRIAGSSRIKRRQLLLLVAACTGFSACVSVPRAAPELSGALTERIQATRQSHIQLLRLYMDEKRKDIDQFLMTDWVPQFAKETFADSAIRVEWLRAVEGNESDRLEFLVHMGPMLQSAINEKRQELIAPLDRAELALSRRLDDNYNEMLAMNTTLTGLLAAAADNTATQQQILRQLDPEQKLPQYLAKTDEIARLLVDRVHDYATNKPKVDSLLALLTASPQ